MRPSTRTLVIATAALVCCLSAQNNDQRQVWDQQHPDLAFWRDNIQVPLSGPGAGTRFYESYQDAFLPPERLRFTMFSGRIVSLTPSRNPTEIVLEMSDPSDPNDPKAVLRAKLLLATPLPGTMPVGSEIEFKGVMRAFQLDLLQVSFEIDPNSNGKIEGWTGN